MALGVRGSNPIWFMVDLAGHAFDDNFYMWVLENTLPYIPATVYHDPDLNVAWTNPVQFLANGTLPNDIFFDPDKVYRLEFRENNGLQPPSQSDPLIYEVNNYVPGVSGESPIDTIALASSNQITNPQFSLVNFIGTYTLSGTDPDPIEIGPGWFLELTGTGTVTINQVALNDNNKNPSNAPYALQITLTGWGLDGVYLRQRFEQNGMLWANKFVSSTLTAKLNGVNQPIKAVLVDSNDTILGQVLTVPVVNQDWNEFTGHDELTATTNPDTPPAAYIDYRLVFPQNVDIYVTSIQLVVQENELEPDFEQDSINRQVDHTFNYYKNQIEFKPIPSILTAWDFTVNPFQFGVSGNVTTTPSYICDQTIMACNTGTVAFARVAESDSLILTTSAPNQSVLLLQYLNGGQALECLLANLSAYVNAYQLNHAGVTCKVYLYFTNSSGSIPALPTIIGSLANDGTFTLTPLNNWVPIPLLNGYSNSFGLEGIAIFSDKALPGFNGLSLSGSTTSPNFAMVVTFAAPTSGTSIVINNIALQQGYIATRSAPKSADEVLRQCQYYYELSAPLGTTSFVNAVNFPMNTTLGAGVSPSVHVCATPFCLPYKTTKRVAPNLSVSNPSTGVVGDCAVQLNYFPGAFSNPISAITLASFFSTTTGTKSLYALPNSATYMANGTNGGVSSPLYCSSGLFFHYELDSRLGVV